MVMSMAAVSSASALEKPTRPCLAATYALLNGLATSEWMLPMLTMRPKPRARMPGSTARVRRATPVSITWTRKSHFAIGNSSSGATCCRPALLTSTSHGRDSAASAAATLASDVTSSATASADPPPERIRAATLPHSVAVEVGDDDVVARPRQLGGDAGADAARRAGDQDCARGGGHRRVGARYQSSSAAPHDRPPPNPHSTTREPGLEPAGVARPSAA